MKKIPTLFVRDPENRSRVLPEVTPGLEWVLRGEGTPTRKFDGTCFMFDGIAWWARREIKPEKGLPLFFQEVNHDPVTGKTVGWEPAIQSSFAKYHDEAIQGIEHFEVGTYELCGPKVNGNPEGFASHILVKHGLELAVPPTLTFDGLKEYLSRWPIEGIVWWKDGEPQAKLKRRDFV